MVSNRKRVGRAYRLAVSQGAAFTAALSIAAAGARRLNTQLRSIGKGRGTTALASLQNLSGVSLVTFRAAFTP